MDSKNKMEHENAEEQLKIDQTNQETIDIYVTGKYLDVELGVKIQEDDPPNDNRDRRYEVILSFHDNEGSESYIHLTRNKEGRFTVYDGRYLDG